MASGELSFIFVPLCFCPQCKFPPPLKAAYGPGQPSLVFATPPPQMNSAPQPRQVWVCLMSSFASSVIRGVPFPDSHSLDTPWALSLSFPLRNIFKTCCFGFQASAECLCVCLSSSLMSTLISFLSPALLPVCCRSSYFTPTGTNTPHDLLHIQRIMKWKKNKHVINHIQFFTCCKLSNKHNFARYSFAPRIYQFVQFKVI